MRNIVILIILSYFFFFFGNGILSLSNPDEVFYAGTAKEMIKHNSWMTPYLFGQPQFEKPIFLYWMLRIAFAVLGIGSFAGRFFPAFFATAGVIAVYLLALVAFKNEKKAFFSGIVTMSSGLYIGLGRTIFTDMIFSVFILLSLTGFFWGYCRQEKKTSGIMLFFIFAGFAVLTKGPLGFFLPLITVLAFLALRKDIKFFSSKALFWGLLVFVLISFPWYMLMIKKYGSTFTREFFYNDHIRRVLEAEHISNDTWHFYPFSMIWAMFPWSAFVLFGLVGLYKNLKKAKEPVYLFLACWIAVVFLVFQPCHSKLVSYIFPLFPALAIVAADFIFGAAQNKKPRLVFFAALLTAAMLVLLFAALALATALLSGYISTYLPDKMPVYMLVAMLFVLALSYSLFIMHRRFIRASVVLMYFVPVIFCVVPLVNARIEPYISSRDMCAYIQKNYQVGDRMLVSKFFTRGVRYYTGKEMAVVDIPGKGFFSPHPIPFLNDDIKVAEFLRKAPVTYCVLKKTTAEQDFKRLADNFDCETLKIIGNEYLIRVRPRQK